MSKIDYAALHSQQEHNRNLSSSGHATGSLAGAPAGGGAMSTPRYGGNFDAELQHMASKLDAIHGGSLDELFQEIRQDAALGDNREFDEGFGTIGPTTKSGLQYASNFHNANLGQNIGAQNLGLPGASEVKPNVGIPRG